MAHSLTRGGARNLSAEELTLNNKSKVQSSKMRQKNSAKFPPLRMPEELSKDNQVQIRRRFQIQQMESEVKKLSDKIQSERQLLRNKIICQQLEHELKKNQIASKMSKRQIILKKLSLMTASPDMDDHNQLPHQTKKKSIQVQLVKPENTQQHQQTKAKTLSSNKSTSKLEKLREVWKKKKEYGDRVQKEYRTNRVKSAFSFIQHEQRNQLLMSQKKAEEAKILKELKKPPLPIHIGFEMGRKRQIERIQSSDNSPQYKLQLLNFLSQAELNRIKLKQVRGEQENMQTLNRINRARTQIMLNYK